MAIFKLPRLEKKKLRKEIWLYPADEKGNSLVAFPHKYQKDYDAMKKGIVQSIFESRTLEEKVKSKKKFENLDLEKYISDEELKKYVDEIFAKEYRESSYKILLDAKNHQKANRGYFNFVNACEINKETGRFGNVCCMSVDLAKELLKSPRSHNKKRKRYNS